MALDLKGQFVDSGEVAKVKETRKFHEKAKKGFKFDEQAHKYLLDGTELLSTTKLIDRYKRPFEKLYISKMVANKNFNSGKEYLTSDATVRAYWNAFGHRASSLGTSGHAFCEAYWLNPVDTIPLHEIERNAEKAMIALQKKYQILNMEQSRGNRKYLLGYTIDLEMRDKVTGEYVLGDFKFTSRFTSEQFKTAKGRNPEYLLQPFRDLKMRDIAKDKGEIQLNIYRHLYEIDTAIPISYGLLIHIDGTAGTNWYGDKGYKGYKVRDMQPMIKKLLAPHAKSNREAVRTPKNLSKML